ncbi:unnamed protein product [Adineta ricciae]|uniref:Uncharacterized protein n=1 Tax=Adineta ricciae TaxID=249248 RepID=A0A815NKF2_ADIRI|nr:unnamed protein product [Adineta ricciae]CAF1430800.1 unnamed protein product [Adineta ricciae]
MVHALRETDPGRFEGLLSTIVIIFAYIQFCIPIRQKALLTVYFVVLWILHIAGHIGYLIGFIHKENYYGIGVFIAWIIASTLYMSGLIYYRVIRGKFHNVQIRNKHFFHFISQLEIILAIYISIYGISHLETISRSSVAFFLLFDFFTGDYDRFHGLLIKAVLHIFVATVTASVVLEFVSVSVESHGYEYASIIADVVSFYFFIWFIFLQFNRRNFKQEPRHGQGNAPPLGTSHTTTLGRIMPRPAYTRTARTETQKL